MTSTKHPNAADRHRWRQMIAAGLALLPLWAAALQQEPKETEAQGGASEASREDFRRVDSNSDESLEWQEIRSAHGPALDLRGWDKRYVLDTFDHDGDGAFSQEEHRMLVVSLEVTDPDRAASAVGAGSDAADSHLTDSVPGAVNNPQEDANATLAQGGDVIEDEKLKDDKVKEEKVGEEKDNVSRPTVYDLAVGDLPGRRVVNARGQNLGKVKQLVKNARTSELGLVIRSGGILGVGSNDLLVDLDKLDLSSELQLVWDTEESATDLKGMAAYQEESHTPVRAEDGTPVRRVLNDAR